MAEINPAGAAMLASARRQMADAPFQFIDVPEWPDAEGKPSRIWYRPILSVNESFEIAHWKAETRDGRYQQAYILIRRALDQNGNPLFNLADEATLLDVDWSVLSRLASQLTQGKPTVADAKKGSETTPTA